MKFFERIFRRSRAYTDADRLFALNRILTAFASELDEGRLFQLIAEAARDLTGAEFGALTLRPVNAEGQPIDTSEGSKFQLAAVIGVSKEEEAHLRKISLSGEGLLAPIFHHGVSIRVADVLALTAYAGDNKGSLHPSTSHLSLQTSREAARHAAFAYAQGQLATEGLHYLGIPTGHPMIRSFLGAPLLDYKGNVRGGLLLGSTEPNQFTQEDLDLIVGMAAQAAISVENARLYHLVQVQAQNEIDESIFLHLYVPNGRYQEDQLASFLRLFENYLQHVEKLHFSIETRRTLHGQIYELKSKNTRIDSPELEAAFSRFESFMSLCQNDQNKAEAVLLRIGMNLSEASRLMTKYAKEYQRLLLDIEHERERKMLDLRQRLESEVFGVTQDTGLAVPQTVQPTALLSHNLDPISFTISHSSVIINPGIQSYIEQAIYGDIHYGTEDKELLQLFEQYTEGLEVIRLRSDLEQLKDTSSSEAERKTAKQKIIGFLLKVAPAIGQSALTVLTAYLEKVLTGS